MAVDALGTRPRESLGMAAVDALECQLVPFGRMHVFGYYTLALA